MGTKNPSKKQVINTAMLLAEKKTWEGVRLHDIADELEVTLPVIHQYFSEKDQIVDAWFNQADEAMLQATTLDNFQDLRTQEKLHHLIFVWLDHLGQHKEITKQMLGGKFEPGHIHVLFPVLSRLSRTVQWLREAALLDETFLKRAAQETVLTSIFVTTLFCWLLDESRDLDKTNTFLKKSLSLAGSSANFIDGVTSSVLNANWLTPASYREH